LVVLDFLRFLLTEGEKLNKVRGLKNAGKSW